MIINSFLITRSSSGDMSPYYLMSHENCNAFNSPAGEAAVRHVDAPDEYLEKALRRQLSIEPVRARIRVQPTSWLMA
jgi:hypothetical protein